MKSRLRFPIRLKFLMTMLLVVTGVVSAIIMTMAGLFHDDKRVYITDLTSMLAVGTAEEARSLLVSYEERMLVYARIIRNEELSREIKGKLLNEFFEDFPELIAVSLTHGEEEIAAAYNGAALESGGLTKDDLTSYWRDNPVAPDRATLDDSYVRNVTLSEALPALALVTARPGPDDEGTDLVTAVIRLDALLRVAGRAEAFETFLIDSDGGYLAHADGDRIAGREAAPVLPGIERVQLQNSIGVGKEFDYDGTPTIGGFAAARYGDVTAAVLIPKSAAYLASRDLLVRLLGVALALLVASTLIGLFGAHQLTRPVERLSSATRMIGQGNFEIQVDVASRDEIGDLAGSFNQMATELNVREAALDQAQSQLIQSEKMAAFGQLGAGIAHEVKNPLAGILGCAQLSLRKVDRETPVGKNLTLIEKETRRCKSIIENLLRFARQEKAILEPIHVNPVVADAIAIVGHQLGMHKITVEQELADGVPEIHGNSNQLQQVLMNLMINAQQAMEGEAGTVRITTLHNESGHVEIRVADTGPGMTPEIKEKLFEPFFTTKPGGKGTGLGLSVSFGIVKDHNGEIRVESEPGQGATFVLTFPPLRSPQTIRGDGPTEEVADEQPVTA